MTGRRVGAAAQESALDRLSRLLTMVPWLVNRQGIDLGQAAADLGITVTQLESDLALLFLCGYGQLPDELIDADWEDGRVFVRNADTIARPLRLGLDEAISLLVGLRALLAVPGLGERDAVERALAKIEAATGSVGAAAVTVDVRLDDEVDEQVVTAARSAATHQRQLRLRYVVPGRDEATERDVDPVRVVSMDGRWYLEGWCHRAQAMRMFRLDRVERLEETGADGIPPTQAQPRDLSLGIFQPDPDDLVVTVHAERSARWIADYYPVEEVRDLGDGRAEITLRTGDLEWLVRLMLRLGGQVSAVAPPELRERVAAAARAGLAGYAALPTPG